MEAYVDGVNSVRKNPTPALNAALLSAQFQMPDAAKDGKNPHFGSRYATLQSVRATVTPHLASNGLVVSQSFEPATPDPTAGVIIVTAMLHTSGEERVSRLFIPFAKKDPQGCGSAITYGRRYALAAICGIASDDDDDGNEASRPTSYTPPPPATHPPASDSKPAMTAAQQTATPPAVVATGRKELGEMMMMKVGGSQEKAKAILSAIIPGKSSPSQLTDRELAIAKMVCHAAVVLDTPEGIHDTKRALQQAIGASTPVENWTPAHVEASWKSLGSTKEKPIQTYKGPQDDCPF